MLKVKFRPLLWPAPLLTYRPTEPLLAGITAVICVVEFTVHVIPLMPGSVQTVSAPAVVLKFTPVMTTVVLLVVDPVLGLTDVNAGAQP